MYQKWLTLLLLAFSYPVVSAVLGFAPGAVGGKYFILFPELCAVFF
jgi:hypothetical protein